MGQTKCTHRLPTMRHFVVVWACSVLVALAATEPGGAGHRGVHANESAAIATLKYIHAAASTFQEAARRDLDGNGVGEYGSFSEMRGWLSVGFARNPASIVTRRGYLFEIHLANNAYRREREMVAYAWPVRFSPGRWGDTRAFAVTADGDVYGCSNRETRYSGEHKPAQDALFLPPAKASRPREIASNGVGRDGNRWTCVQ